MSRHSQITSNLGVCTVALCSTLTFSTASAAEFPTGTYEAKAVPFTVSFDDKGQFHVKKGETLEVAGTYSVKAGEVRLTDVKGPWACTKPGQQTGAYSWKYEDAVLTLSKVTDQCEDRVKSLINLAWKQK